MDFWPAIRKGVAKYAVFSGRASRSEFWFWVLFTTIAGTVAGMLDHAIGRLIAWDAGAIAGLFGLGTLLPSVAVAARRLHDSDRSAWWLLLFFVPLFNFVLIVFFCLKGTRGYNRFGANPLPAVSTTLHRVKAA